MKIKTLINSIEDQNDNLDKLKRDINKKLKKNKDQDQKLNILKQDISNGNYKPLYSIKFSTLEMHEKLKTTKKLMENDNTRMNKALEVQFSA